MSKNCVGLLAYSKCGRDRKRLFCIVATDGEDFVYIADGRLHKLEAPKKKRLKHLSFVKAECIAVPSDNNVLYKRISEYEFEARRDYSAEG